jgi:hypothetical protein
MKDIDRRRFLELGIGGALALGLPLHLIAQEPSSSIPTTAKPFPLEAIRLTPSMYLDSINANIRYLHKLEPIDSFTTFACTPGSDRKETSTADGKPIRSPGTRSGIT